MQKNRGFIDIISVVIIGVAALLAVGLTHHRTVSPAVGSGGQTVSGGSITINNTPLSGGTTNGVIYQNSSNQISNGTGFTFTGTNVGIGSTTPSTKLDVGGNMLVSGTITAGNFVDTTLSGTHCVSENAGLLGNSNCVDSIASSASTLTVSSPTGAVNVDFNLGHTSSWGVVQNFLSSATGGTATTTITSTGKIGYATTTPTEAITVVGGGIMTTENAQSTTTSITVNMTSQNQSLLQIGTAATTVTLGNLIPGQAKRIVICNPGASASTITWATSPANKLLWSGATAPTQTTTANKCDVYTFTVTQGTSTAATSFVVLGGFIQNF